MTSKSDAFCVQCNKNTEHTLRFNSDHKIAAVCQRCHQETPLAEWHRRKTNQPVANDPSKYIKRGDFVTTNDAIYKDRDAPSQPDRMTFSSLEADADGYVTAQPDPTLPKKP